MAFSLVSPVFADNDRIPSQYTCDGDNSLPPLLIEGVPEGTESFVLLMDDPDIPDEIKEAKGIEKFEHLAVYNIPGEVREITNVDIYSLLSNGMDEHGYTGPCPPREYEPTEHRYVFRIYALPGMLNFITAPTFDELEEAAKGSALASSTLIGRYERASAE